MQMCVEEAPQRGHYRCNRIVEYVNAVAVLAHKTQKAALKKPRGARAELQCECDGSGAGYPDHAKSKGCNQPAGRWVHPVQATIDNAKHTQNGQRCRKNIAREAQEAFTGRCADQRGKAATIENAVRACRGETIRQV